MSTAYGGDDPQPAPATAAPPASGPQGGPPARWPLAAEGRRLPSFPHAEPLQYHQMLRTWTYAWWKPVVGVVLVVAGMLLVAPLVVMPVLLVGVAVEGGPFWPSFERAATLQAVGPAALLYLNLTLASGILVTWFVMRFVHRMRLGWLTSVVPKMRWKFFGVCLGLSVVALAAVVAVSLLMPGSQETDPGPVNQFTSRTLAIVGVVVLTTPLQSAAEEYVFRGYLVQALGSVFWNKWVALIATATLFAFAHGVQNFPLWFDRFAFGFLSAWLVIRTGGLEAGIAMHILNNFLAYGMALAFGDLTDTLNVSQVGWSNIVLTGTQTGTYTLLVVLAARKMGVQTRSRPPALEEASGPRAVAAPVPSAP